MGARRLQQGQDRGESRSRRPGTVGVGTADRWRLQRRPKCLALWPVLGALACLGVVTTLPVCAQAPLVPPAQPRQPAAAAKKDEAPPKRSRHGRRKRVPPKPTHWGIIAGRPVASPMSVFHYPWPAAWGHPSRPVASPMAALNVERDPVFTPYVPGRPIASHMASLSLLTPHFVVRQPPAKQLWIGGGRLRTARAVPDNPRTTR